MEAIISFRGRNNFLSNMYSCVVVLDNIEYPSLECAYVAARTLNPEERKQFETMSSSDAKKNRYTVTLRKDWETVKVSLMAQLLRSKFTLNKSLRDRLLATGNAPLIEGNWWHDDFWGVCTPKGLNILGRLLMLERNYWFNREDLCTK